MSQENVEIHRRLVEAFNEHDVDAVIAFADPQIEWQSELAGVGGGYRGHDGVRRWLADLADAWGDEIRGEPEAFFDLGEQTLMFYVLYGRGQRSDADVAMQVASINRWRDGLVVYAKAYTHREDALSELGVSEDELEPIDP